jgi:hypothetical protein
VWLEEWEQQGLGAIYPSWRRAYTDFWFRVHESKHSAPEKP